MLTISCSLLEQVRNNYLPYVELLSTGEKISRGGTHGMFAYWQDVSKKIHQNELNLSSGIKTLTSLYSNFDDNKRNRDKQNLLLDQLVKYHQCYEKQNFQFYDGRRRIRWPIIPEIHLSGLTPWVFESGEEYFAYYVIEKKYDWKKELRFPLLQKYMSEHNVKCNFRQLNMGVYFLDTGVFEFRKYSTKEILSSVIETKQLFGKIYEEFRLKSVTK
ncbi:MAG: hypothetical protein J0I41_16490 [Filimonas sp.]|nr:hypothetical protein [Filimonas sp.]